MDRISLGVPSISCSSCAGKIEEAIKSMNGVEKVVADMKTQSVRIDYNPDSIKPQDISDKLTSMGYEVQQ